MVRSRKITTENQRFTFMGFFWTSEDKHFSHIKHLLWLVSAVIKSHPHLTILIHQCINIHSRGWDKTNAAVICLSKTFLKDCCKKSLHQREGGREHFSYPVIYLQSSIACNNKMPLMQRVNKLKRKPTQNVTVRLWVAIHHYETCYP